jgi:poly(A) polymerase
MGLLAGVQCAVLTARVCQLYPAAAPATIVRKFFALYGKWDWGARAPVSLGETPRCASLHMPQWGEARRDRHDPIVILTPVYPEQNTARASGHYARRMLRERIEEAAGRLENGGEWRDLFRAPDRPCKRFLTVSAWADDAAAQRRWGGFVESRIPALLRCLDRNQRWKTECLEVYPVPGAFHVPEPGRPHQRRFFVGMKTDYGAAEAVLGQRRVDIQDALEHFRSILDDGRKDDAHFEFGLVARRQMPDAARPPAAKKRTGAARKRDGERSAKKARVAERSI